MHNVKQTTTISAFLSVCELLTRLRMLRLFRFNISSTTLTSTRAPHLALAAAASCQCSLPAWLSSSLRPEHAKQRCKELQQLNLDNPLASDPVGKLRVESLPPCHTGPCTTYIIHTAYILCTPVYTCEHASLYTYLDLA